jgi:hypothetical protein
MTDPIPSADPAGDYARVKDSLGKSVVRTVVPAVVGVIVAALAKAHLDVDTEALTGLIALAVTTAYYTLVRLAEQKGHAAAGRLLGAKGAPTYKA